MEDKEKLLWLDDIRDPYIRELDSVYEVHWAKNASQFKYEFAEYRFDVISFDHDLGEDETGYDCVKWMVQCCLDNHWPIPTCYYHTSNPVGRTNMETYVDNARKFIADYGYEKSIK